MGELQEAINTMQQGKAVRHEAMASVLGERINQDRKWGVQHHDPFTWLAILMEEVGEASQEALTLQFGEAGKGHGDLREEVVHIAAVALAWLEDIDRGGSEHA